MGNSASATLFYGYAFNKENAWPWEDDDDLDYDYEKWESFRERDWEAVHFYIHLVLGKTEAEVDAMGWEERSKIEKTMPFVMDTWGYLDGQGCWAVMPKDEKACHSCSWDGPQAINPKDMDPEAEWDEVLKEAAEKMGFILDGQEPGWHIVCSYG